MKKLFIISLFVFCIGCTNEPDAKRILQDQGYTDIQMTGYRPFICGGDYNYHTGFSAKAPNTGHQVTGAVCSGFLKGNSIKLD